MLHGSCSAVVEHNMRVHMLCPVEHEPGAGVWGGMQKREFWREAIDEANVQKGGQRLL